MPDPLHDIVKRMVEAGESEDNIALVIQHYQEQPAAQSEEPGFLSNLGTSTANFLGNLGAGVRDVVQGGIAGGAMMAGKPGYAKALQPESIRQATEHPIETAKGVGRYASERYGSPSAIGHTLYTDPVGAAADVSSVLTGGGALAAKAPGIVGKVGQASAALGGMIDPMANVGRVAGVAARAAEPVLGRVAEGLNAGALGVSKSLEERNPTVNIPREFAKEGLTVRRGSAKKFAKTISSDEQALTEGIAGSTATMTPDEYVTHLRQLESEKRALLPGTFSGEADTVNNRVMEILTDPNTPANIPVQQAQRTKLELNKRFKAQREGAPPPPLDAQMQDAERRGLMEAIQNKEPGIGEINRRLGPRYALEEAQTEAIRKARKQPFKATYPTMAGGILGASLAGPLGSVKGVLLAKALESPYLKSLLAKEAMRAGTKLPGMTAGLEQAGPTLTRLALLEQMRGQD